MRLFTRPACVLSALPVAASLLLLGISEAGAAVVVKKDGSGVAGTFDSAATITLTTASGDVSVKLSDVRWMAGSDIRRVRVAGTKALLVGTLRDAQLVLQTTNKGKVKPLAIPAAEVVFLFNGDVDLGKTGKVRIEEGGGDTRVLFYSRSGRGTKLSVTLLPENWQGNLQISKPIYRERMSNREKLEVGFTVEADAPTYADLAKIGAAPEAARIECGMAYIFTGGSGFASGPAELKLERDKTATEERYVQQYTYGFGQAFYMEMGGRVISQVSGSATFFLYLHTGEESLAGGQVRIGKTMSNVLRLTMTVDNR